MKCSIMLHFIKVYTVFKVLKIFRQKNTIKKIKLYLTPPDMYNGLSEVLLYLTRRKNPLV